MGYQMAYNLFSKQYVQANAQSFVVCDAIPEVARSFCEEFSGQYPDSQISIANNPEEWVPYEYQEGS